MLYYYPYFWREAARSDADQVRLPPWLPQHMLPELAAFSPAVTPHSTISGYMLSIRCAHHLDCATDSSARVCGGALADQAFEASGSTAQSVAACALQLTCTLKAAMMK